MSRFSLALCALSALAVAPIATAQQNCLTTTFTGSTSTSQGCAALFDMVVANPVLIQSIDCNFTAAAGVPVGLDFWVTPNTWVGNETNQSLWTLLGSDNGAVVSAGGGQPTTITFATPILLQAGTYGVSLVSKGATSHRYLSGTATSYSDSFLTLNLGAIQATPFTSGLLNPRIWNGRICYLPGSGLFPDFDATPRSGNAPLNVQFTDHSYSSDPGGVLGWQWDVDGDGVVDYSTQNPSHTYAVEGYYNVTLSVVDATHGIQTITKNAFISCDAVEASFTFALTGASSVQFTDTSLGHPTGWAWDFDNDGTVDSNLQNPSHAYPAPGAYSCKLIVTDAFSTDSTTVDIGVSILPIPPFSSTYTSATQTRGFWFQTPVRFSIASLKVPDESAHGLQNVAVYNLGQVPPTYTATMPGVPVFFSAGQPSSQSIPANISFDAGDYVGILGACGDASTMRNSYGAGAFASSIFGQPVTLMRFITQTNIVSNSGACPVSGTSGSIARVEVGISSATGLPYGTGTASGSGAAAPVLATTGLPRIGTTAELKIDNGDAGAVGVVFVGFGRLSLPTPFGEILVNNVALGLPLNGGTPLPAGATPFPFAIPNTPALNGAGPINWQAICVVPGSPNGLAMSNGQEWYLGF